MSTAQEFFRALENAKPLDYEKPAERALYVENLHGEIDPIALLSKEIEWREGQGVYLYSGQMGSGKSTELLRLKVQLAANGYSVFYTDLEEWLNPQRPLELGSFLLAVVASWVDQLGTQGQRTPAQRFMDFLTRTKVDLSALSLEGDMGVFKGTLQAALKQDDSVLTLIEKALNANKTRFVAEVHKFVRELVADFPIGRKIVLLVDSLEKVRGVGPDADLVFDSVLGLFQNTQALQLPLVHVVYSLSYLVLEQNKQLPAQLGNAVAVSLPSIHVFQKHSAELDEVRVLKMQELLGKRFPDWQAFFSPAQIQVLIRETGGDLRDFMRSLRFALIAHDEQQGQQISNVALLAALNQIRPTLVLPAEHIAWMARLQASYRAELGGDIGAKTLDRYLTTKHVMAYLNGVIWYALHPLIRDEILKISSSQP